MLFLADRTMHVDLIREFNFKKSHEIYAAIAIANIGFVCQCFNAPFYLESIGTFQMPANKQEMKELILKTEDQYEWQRDLYKFHKDAGLPIHFSEPESYVFDQLPSFWQLARMELAGLYLTEAEYAIQLATTMQIRPQSIKNYFSNTGRQGGKAKKNSIIEQQRQQALAKALKLALDNSPYKTLDEAAHAVALHPEIESLCEKIGALRGIAARISKIKRHFSGQPLEIKAKISRHVATIAEKQT